MKPTPATRPPKAERDQLRRDEIVDAARRCMLADGFHRTSMAQIASAAGMSVGQIYRYFPSKETIIGALVERLVAQRLAWVASTGGRVDLAQMLVDNIAKPDIDDGERNLLLEMQAESARNPAVAEIVRSADARLHARAVAVLREDYPGLAPADAAARVEFMAMLAEGSMFRRGLTPLHDPERLMALCLEIVSRLFTPGARRR